MHPRAPQPAAVLVVLLAGCAAAVAGAALAAWWPDTLERSAPWLPSAVTAWAVACCWWRAAAVGVDRAGWLALGAALAASLIPDAASVVWPRPPSPWIDHAGDLGFFLAAATAVLLLVRARIPTLAVSAWIDGVVGGLVAAALFAAFVFAPLSSAAGGDITVVLSALARPVGGILLLGLVVAGSAVQRWRTGSGWALVAVALGVTAIGDALAVVATAQSDGPPPGIAALSLVAVALVALAAWRPSTRPTPASAASGSMPPIVAGLFALVGAGVLAVDVLAGVDGVSHVLLAAALLIIVTRFWLAGLGTRRLAHSHHEAHTDELTGLGNRRSFYRQADELLRDGDPAALLLLDLNRFKELNDTVGHQAGDDLLCEVANRLRDTLPPTAVLARLGGDEFVALLPKSDALAGLDAANAVRTALDEPFALDALVTHAQASVGVATAPADGATRTELLRHADVAMYNAKAQMGGVALYAAADDEHSRDRLLLAGELRTALAEGQLVLHYQPKADLQSGAVTDVEALVRWEHPRHGLLFPDAFLPIAEQHGLMRDLTLVVLRLVLRQQRFWRRIGVHLRVAVNLAGANLLDVGLPADVAALLEQSGVPARALQFEITEGTVMENPGRALEVLAGLAQLGISLSLDDFGTGYSSLAYLKRLPVSEVKIDKSFVLEMTTDARDAVIVRAIVDLGRNLGLHVVAEGVETAEHWRRLAADGCHTAQGYHLARPMRAAAIPDWLLERRAGGGSEAPLAAVS